MDFHVARAFELFVNHVVHTRARINQGRCKNRQRPAFFDIACRTEKALGALQGIGIDTARQNLPGTRNDGVVGASQTRNRIQKDDDVFLAFGQTLGFFDDHFGHLHVACGRLVERTGNHFAAHGALHLGHFFRTFVNQEHDEDAIGVIGRDGVGNVLHQDGLTGFGTCNK